MSNSAVFRFPNRNFCHRKENELDSLCRNRMPLLTGVMTHITVLLELLSRGELDAPDFMDLQSVIRTQLDDVSLLTTLLLQMHGVVTDFASVLFFCGRKAR
jgi:hypothetical protein